MWRFLITIINLDLYSSYTWFLRKMIETFTEKGINGVNILFAHCNYFQNIVFHYNNERVPTVKPCHRRGIRGVKCHKETLPCSYVRTYLYIYTTTYTQRPCFIDLFIRYIKPSVK